MLARHGHVRGLRGSVDCVTRIEVEQLSEVMLGRDQELEGTLDANALKVLCSFDAPAFLQSRMLQFRLEMRKRNSP
jgi:hypothetical protein